MKYRNDKVAVSIQKYVSDIIQFKVKNKDLVLNRILPSYTNLSTHISKLKASSQNDKGLCHFAKGQDYYNYLVRSVTSSSRSVKDIKKLIQTQINSDVLDLHAALKKCTSSLSETPPITMEPSKIIEALKSNICASFPTSADVNVTVKNVPAALEEHLSPAFYLIPAIDNYKENVIYINKGYLMDDISLFTTLAHEGYPGHLYQTTYYQQRNADPLRHLLSFKGYVEGWATYAEMCSYSLLPLENCHAQLLQRNSSLLLGLYAMADFGIHYEGWDLPRTTQFFSGYGIEDSAAIQEIYHLILGDPGNYLAYYLGYVEILELKREMIEKEGADFSQKGFHEKLLNVGPAPFDIVRKYVLGT